MEKSVIIHQTGIIEKLLNDFEDEIKIMRNYATSEPPHTVIVQPHDDALMTIDRQKRFTHGVGTLLYLIKLSRPDLANFIRELTKEMMKGSEGDYKLLLQAINFVYNTKNCGLKINPRITDSTWTIDSYVDADWAGDVDTRKKCICLGYLHE